MKVNRLRSFTGLIGTATVAILLLGATPTAAAGSDDPRGATKFRDLPYSDTTNASLATDSPDDPSNFCRSDPPNNSVWYRFQPKSNGTVNIDTFGSDYDTVLAIYTSGPGQSAKNFTLVTCNDDFFTDFFFSLQSQVQFNGQRNQTYFIMVDTFGDNTAGNLVLNAY